MTKSRASNDTWKIPISFFKGSFWKVFYLRCCVCLHFFFLQRPRKTQKEFRHSARLTGLSTCNQRPIQWGQTKSTSRHRVIHRPTPALLWRLMEHVMLTAMQQGWGYKSHFAAQLSPNVHFSEFSVYFLPKPQSPFLFFVCDSQSKWPISHFPVKKNRQIPVLILPSQVLLLTSVQIAERSKD